MKRSGFFLLAASLALASGATLRGAGVGLIHIDGAISPATANYIDRAIDVAADAG